MCCFFVEIIGLVVHRILEAADGNFHEMMEINSKQRDYGSMLIVKKKTKQLIICVQ